MVKEAVKSLTDSLSASALKRATRGPDVWIFVSTTRATLGSVCGQLVRCPGTPVNVQTVLQVCFSFLSYV